MKHILIIGGIVVGLGVIFFAWSVLYAPEVPEREMSPEEVTLAFMEDIALFAPPQNEAAGERLLRALSERAGQEMGADTLSSDIAGFIGVQDIPEKRASISFVEEINENRVSVLLTLHYSGGDALRAVTLVKERGRWKIDNFRTPPKEENLTPENPQENGEQNNGGQNPPNTEEPVTTCFVGGCSSQVCSEDPNVITTCEWREEYACYQNATCERQGNGQCGWTKTESLNACLMDAGVAE